MIKDILEKFKKHKNHIFEYKSWLLLYRDKQVTPGSLVLIYCEKDEDSLGGISSEAFSHLPKFINAIEESMRKIYKAEKFNYLALMMVDSQPHFHIFPRYSKPVKFEGKECLDLDWPLPVSIKKNIEINGEISAMFKKNLSSNLSRILN